MPYQGRQPGVGVRNRFVYTATAAQTTFSGADDNGRTLAYQDGAYVDVYLNGVMLVATTDFTATTKTSISLTSAAAASDIVEILAYDISSIADTVSALNGGSFGGAVAVSGNFTVDGTTLFVDAASNNVGVGTSSMPGKFRVSGADAAAIALVNGASYGVRLGSAAGVGAYVEGVDTGGVSLYQPLVVGGSALLLATAGTERARIDASGNLLVGTTGAGTMSGNGVIGVGETGGIIANSSSSVANGGTLDIAINTGGAGYQGFLVVSNTNLSNAAIRTHTTFSVFGRSTDSSIQQIATDDGTSGGAAFTVTTPSNGVIRVTNTSGSTTAIAIQFFGGTSF